MGLSNNETVVRAQWGSGEPMVFTCQEVYGSECGEDDQFGDPTSRDEAYWARRHAEREKREGAGVGAVEDALANRLGCFITDLFSGGFAERTTGRVVQGVPLVPTGAGVLQQQSAVGTCQRV